MAGTQPGSGDRDGVAPAPSASRAGGVRFGDFHYFPDRGVLLRDGRAIKIGSRAMALLTALADRPGQIVPNETLIEAGWPGIAVEDGNLRVQIATLRRILGGDSAGQSLIYNAPGRGYALTTEVGLDEVADRPAPAPDLRPFGLASPLTALLGRDDAVTAALDRLGRYRCVTLVGTGGIGKTRVAIDAAWAVVRAGGRRVCFVDLAPLSSDDFVATTVSATLRLEDAPETPPIERIARALADHPTLMVLDNCEHVLERTAELAEALLLRLPELRVLATSREPLGVADEATIRLGGLAMPEAETIPATLADAVAYPAIQLLHDRALASSDAVAITEADVPALVRICRRLDGIPLAIELAAARVEAFGLPELSAYLDTQLSILDEGRRHAPVRQRALSATLEWSYGLLNEDEQALLTALGAFRGRFSMDAAVAVSGLPSTTTIRRLYGLVSKSLVVVDRDGPVVRYRLLETTRHFAEGKLKASRAGDGVARRHADYFLAHFHAGPAPGGGLRAAGEYRDLVADVRAAIAWALEQSGDARLAIRLIVDTAPMWRRLAMLSEYAAVIENAIRRFWSDPAVVTQDTVWLAPSLHNAHYNTFGLSDRIFPMLEKALLLSDANGDVRCMLTCLWPMFGTRLTEARYREALGYARQFADLALRMADPVQEAMGHRIVGLSLWRDGDLDGAIDRGARALQPAAERTETAVNMTLIYKQGVASRANFSNLLWLKGMPDEALRLAMEAVEIGLDSDVIGLSYALAQTIIPLSFWTGDLDGALSQTALLVRLARDNDLGYWHFWGRCYESVLDRIRTGTTPADDIIAISGDRIDGLHRHILATILPDLPIAWVTARDRDDRRGAPHWCSAELERVAGRERLAAGRPDVARNHFRQALAIASGQGARAWELRAATDLAETAADGAGREADRTRLAAALAHFGDGDRTGDVLRARSVLAGS